MLKDIITKTRSYRRFNQDPLDYETLKDLIDLARLSASAGNIQPLKYMITFTPEKNELVFPHLAWAGYLKDWPRPDPEEKPTAYIIILGDTKISEGFGCDHGIAAQSILLGASEKGIGGCMIGSIDREGLQADLAIAAQYKILLVLALGKPKEKIVLETAAGGNIKYWRDENEVHHVPKRALDEIIVDAQRKD
jgi:nitroreductase